MSRTLGLLVSGALAFPPAMAFAQEGTITVFFEPSNEPLLNSAIAAALAQPPFELETRYAPATLVVAIPDQIGVEHLKVSGTIYTFTVTFSRDGASLGQSLETCNKNKLSDCIDQLVNDIESAARIGR